MYTRYRALRVQPHDICLGAFCELRDRSQIRTGRAAVAHRNFDRSRLAETVEAPIGRGEPLELAAERVAICHQRIEMHRHGVVGRHDVANAAKREPLERHPPARCSAH